MELNKTLAEMAIIGMFEGMQNQAMKVVEFLRTENISDVSMLSMEALNLLSREKYDDAILMLKDWCKENEPDIPHSYLALCYWKTGDSFSASVLCHDILKESTDHNVVNLSSSILTQLEAAQWNQ